MRLKILLFLINILIISNVYSQNSSIRGTVFDRTTGEYLPGVTIYVKNNQKGTITDLDGKFNLNIAPGTYNLRISFISYKTINLTEVVVNPGEVTMLDDLGLGEATLEISEVVVTGKAIRNTETAMISRKRRSANLIDGVSADLLKKTGDSDAASSVKRVPGVTVSKGKYVFVRGLGDRYIKTNLNGADIPGLDPDRNSLQMDIFPNHIIDNIIVHKSFSADLPADFTGGIVDINIKDFPDEQEGKISVSAGYKPNSHFISDYLTYNGGNTDFLGFDDGTRAIPATDNIPMYAEVVGNPDGEAGLRYKKILTGFNPIMAVKPANSFMDYSLGVSYGNQKKLNKYTIGYNIALSYKNNTEYFENAEDGRYGLSSPDIYEMEQREHRTGSYGVNNVLVSGLAGFAIKTNKSKIRLNLLHLQNGESKAGIFDYSGSDQGSDFNAIENNLDYNQRSLTNMMIDGKHTIKNALWDISWKISPTLSLLQAPDVRFSRYEITDGSYRIGTEVGFPERIWRELSEINLVNLIHVSRDFTLNGQKGKINFGGTASYKQRDYTIQNFVLNIRGDFPLTGDPNELLLAENLWPRNGNVGEGTTFETPFIPNNPNRFEANSFYTAGYLSIEISPVNNIKSVFGLRFENFNQYYTGTDQQSNHALNNEKVLGEDKYLENHVLFPSINLIYSLTEKQNLRFSYSKTIARPSFKELSFAEIYDPISGITFIGGLWKDGDDLAGTTYWDGNLTSTAIHNFDLRWEYFPDRGQMISVSGFFKKFIHPIEIVQFTKQIGAFQPRNVGDGKVYGAEFELRHNLGIISESLSSISINSNITLTHSLIELSNIEYNSRLENARTGQTIDKYRDMAGQAPYIVNAGISFNGRDDSFLNRIETGLFYNVQGLTLEYVGVADRPDIYIKSYHSLNFNSGIKFGSDKNLSLNFKVQNILDQKNELIYRSFKANDQIFKSRKPGRNFSVSLSFSFL